VDPAGVQIEEDEVDDQITLGPGAIWNLRPGQKANLPESKSPVEQFWQFMEANLKLIGMSVGIPYEVLIKSFNASYSASQASIQDAARGWKILTNEFASKYCQPVYEQFVELLVRQGLLDCPKFDKGLFFQKAWTGAEWYGPVVLNIDPVKNARASELLIKNQLSTKTIESRKYGNDFDTDIKVLGEEQRMAEANLGAPAKEEEKDE
jgi:capsid protein